MNVNVSARALKKKRARRPALREKAKNGKEPPQEKEKMKSNP
jgi:hypothetical protein